MQNDTNNPEAQLAPLVADWLRAQGLVVYAEVPLYQNSIDLVGIDFATNRIVTVELKTSFSITVLRSAMINQLATVESWAAAPTQPRPRAVEVADQQDIGLLRVADPMEIIRPAPDPTDRASKAFKIRGHFVAKKILEFCRLDEPSDAGGIRWRKGRGPAQDVYRRVQRFLKEHPGATWPTIYQSVPNHYAHARSMMQSMHQLYYFGKVDKPISASMK